MTKDPFAVDFFGISSSSSPSGELSAFDAEINSGKQPRDKKLKKNEWHLALPQITREEAEFSAALHSLPDDLTAKAADKIAEIIARYTFRLANEARCSIISVAETNLRNAVENLARSPQIFFTLECQPGNPAALFAINTDFASAVIDLILGSQGEEFADPRDLSPIEGAIVEFLIVNILNEINEFLGEPVLCLQSVRTLPDHVFEEEKRGGEFVFVIETGDFSGILTAFAPPSFLNGLNKTRNPLLKIREKGIEKPERLAPKIDMRLYVGTTNLDAESVLFLEPDDIVLIEKPEISLEKGLIGDNLQICVGRGKNFRLTGTAETKEFGGEMYFKIREISSEQARRKFTPMNLEMDEKETELEEETGFQPETAEENTVGETENDAEEIETETEAEESTSTAALENVQVALRVEIAADKISLRELQNMRAGQIIALGCRPTDPVRLVTDNREEPVATGELIEIEGQLGVRLTKVFI